VKFVIAIFPLFLIFAAGCLERETDDRDVSEKYDTICIDGHVYYERHLGDRGFAAIRLSPEGKPIRCKQGIQP